MILTALTLTVTKTVLVITKFRIIVLISRCVPLQCAGDGSETC